MLWRFKSRAPRARRHSDHLIAFVPLTPTELADIVAGVATRREAQRLPSTGNYATIDEMCVTLDASMRTLDGARLTGSADLPIDDLADLYDLWIEVQESSTASFSALEAYLELRVAKQDNDAIDDVFRAEAADSPQGFYGVASLALTDGQMQYYLCCRSVYDIVYSPDEGKKRCRSLQMVRKKAAQLLASASTWEKIAA